jgi:hypothetical protein
MRKKLAALCCAAHLIQQVLCCDWQVVQHQVDPVLLIDQLLEFLQSERHMGPGHRVWVIMMRNRRAQHCCDSSGWCGTQVGKAEC